MTTIAKRSVLQSLIEKPEAELPDWRLLCDLLRLDMASEASAARVVGILRAVSRSLAAGLWHESRPMTFAALSGSNIRDPALSHPGCFAKALQHGEFSASAVAAGELPPSWRAAAWPHPWMLASPVSARRALLFTIYATEPSRTVIGNLQILLPAIAQWFARGGSR